jgi:glycosyltransferase involved in cell wall biosynthesis
VRITALLPARDEEATIAPTVLALRGFTGSVVVVDDGSVDRTAEIALEAGATVLRSPVRHGKGGAMEQALDRLPPADVWVFVDGDLGATAVFLEPLVSAVTGGGADLAIAVFPAQAGGGLGTVKRLARAAIARLGLIDVREPLSGQRAISAACLEAVRPLAPGFGVETAMTIDAARAGFRIEEIPIEGLTHRATGRGLVGFRHRGRQGLDILAAVGARIAGGRGDPR